MIGRAFSAVVIGASLLAAAPPSAPPLRDGAGDIRPLPKPAIILFWAAWCVPCRAEVARFAKLSAAAAPMPLIIVAMDEQRTTRLLLRSIAADRVRFPADASVDISSLMPGGVGVLPAAVAFDASGAPCATMRGGVDEQRLADWRAQCLAGRSGNRHAP